MDKKPYTSPLIFSQNVANAIFAKADAVAVDLNLIYHEALLIQ